MHHAIVIRSINSWLVSNVRRDLFLVPICVQEHFISLSGIATSPLDRIARVPCQKMKRGNGESLENLCSGSLLFEYRCARSGMKRIPGELWPPPSQSKALAQGESWLSEKQPGGRNHSTQKAFNGRSSAKYERVRREYDGNRTCTSLSLSLSFFFLHRRTVSANLASFLPPDRRRKVPLASSRPAKPIGIQDANSFR